MHAVQRHRQDTNARSRGRAARVAVFLRQLHRHDPGKQGGGDGLCQRVSTPHAAEPRHHPHPRVAEPGRGGSQRRGGARVGAVRGLVQLQHLFVP